VYGNGKAWRSAWQAAAGVAACLAGWRLANGQRGGFARSDISRGGGIGIFCLRHNLAVASRSGTQAGSLRQPLLFAARSR